MLCKQQPLVWFLLRNNRSLLMNFFGKSYDNKCTKAHTGLETTLHFSLWPSWLYQILHELVYENPYKPAAPVEACITYGELFILLLYVGLSWSNVGLQYRVHGMQFIHAIRCHYNVIQYNMMLWYSIQPCSAWGRAYQVLYSQHTI